MALVPFFTGLLFGIGLLLSGMTDPVKVTAFLDVTGRWDPSLALVMAGAIGVALLPFQLEAIRRRKLGVPSGNDARIDVPLLLGSAMFGIGWGIGGFCPGPAFVGMVAGHLPAVAFVIAMVFGMELQLWASEARDRRLRRNQSA